MHGEQKPVFVVLDVMGGILYPVNKNIRIFNMNILWIFVAMTWRIPQAQEIIDKQQWVMMQDWYGCESPKAVAAHNYKTLWKRILAYTWKTITLWECKYKFVWIEIVEHKTFSAKSIYKKWHLTLYTCFTNDSRLILLRHFKLITK